MGCAARDPVGFAVMEHAARCVGADVGAVAMAGGTKTCTLPIERSTCVTPSAGDAP